MKREKIVSIVFVALLLIVPVVQIFIGVPAFDDIRYWEAALEQQSFLRDIFPTRFQSVLTKQLHSGNEKAIIGKGNELFYSTDIQYYQRPINKESIPCIIDFARQLKERGIDLIMMPVPLKPAYASSALSNRIADGTVLRHPEFDSWKAELEKAGITFAELPEKISYLREDTHWDAESMEKAAQSLARNTLELNLINSNLTPYIFENMSVTNRGDVYSMLNLGADNDFDIPQSMTIHPVITPTGEAFIPSKNAEVLLLGDSFSNIYSLHGMGWGSDAGLAEHLAFNLQAPVDAIRRNDAGAMATRKILQTEQKRGRNRLAGKKIVVWEFAERELAFGDWAILDMTEEYPTAISSFLALESGDSIMVKATITDRSTLPMPDKVTYGEHIITLHLTDLTDLQGNPIEGDAVVYTFAMKDRALTPQAYLRHGDSISATLKKWQDHEADYGGFNRTDLDDFELQLQEPLWCDNIRRIDN